MDVKKKNKLSSTSMYMAFIHDNISIFDDHGWWLN